MAGVMQGVMGVFSCLGLSGAVWCYLGLSGALSPLSALSVFSLPLSVMGMRDAGRCGVGCVA